MKTEKIQLDVRQMAIEDIPAVAALSRKVYGKHSFNRNMLAGQLANFPEGQFVAEYNGEIVGHCATFIISGEIAFSKHSWGEITGYGYAARHDPDGDYLYGMEVCVDKEYRGLRIGQRLYDARKRLCETLRLKGIVFGGRMPNLAKRMKQCGTAEAYLEQVQNRKLRDPVVAFQTRNGFEIIGVLPGYLPSDTASMGYAAHMVWYNSKVDAERNADDTRHTGVKSSVRIASVQFQVRKVTSFEDFAAQIEYFVDVAADYRSDFVLFPELITIPLLSIETRRLTPQESMEKITAYTEPFVQTLQHMAVSYNINIIGGSHPTMVGDTLENHAYVFLRDGSVYTQPKIHPTPNERHWWNIRGGSRVEAIPTDCGPIGIMVCYDSEFPEMARHLTDQGVKLMFVPFCTDSRQGYLRVRYCCQARAIENQLYVATAGIVGNLPDVENMDVHYAQSGIFTPCDFPFARDGIAAEADANTETVVFADVQMDAINAARNSGTVQNLKDRRFDLYNVAWNMRDKA
jgi:predicted amidohydrolase/ribosomal protein S18 acetylase RimI-like enzyme